MTRESGTAHPRTPGSRLRAGARLFPTTPPAIFTTRRIVLSLRVLTAATLLDVLAQAALAGLFVTGDVDMLSWHHDNATLLITLVELQALVAAPLWFRRVGPRTPVVANLLLVALALTQFSLGEDRVLTVHLPLGMTIFGLSALLTVWAWRLPVGGE
ncbi:hypothetical protein AB0K60_19335 [Thermopolyspora sp. NPDC052614]|uniref:hypothetical protein n=1 Tax=Thermopolyspora sp. NPDC052614 TaxID=3155682 RepID=UPI003436CCD1